MSQREIIKLLLVEDNPADARLIRETLSESALIEFQITDTTDVESAISQTTSLQPDVVLLDLQLTTSKGIETLRHFQAQTGHTPVIVMTSLDDERLALHALQYGAQDYLVKGSTDARQLVRTITHAIERNKLLCSLQEAHHRERHLATHDVVTGLPNRLLFQDRLSKSLPFARRYQQTMAVMFIDLDRFKAVNDTYGHDAGDHLLRQVGTRLQACVRESDTLARMGGDEFAVLLLNISRPEDAAKVAHDFVTSLCMPFQYREHDLFIGCSIGIAIYPHDSEDAETLIKAADTAMYQAKASGGNRHAFYTADLSRSAAQRLLLETSLRQALHNNELRLFYQPKLDTRTEQVIAMEALVRWQHPSRGLIEPNDFIPIAEESGLIMQLDEWVLREACRQNKAWQEAGLPPVTVAINISARHFCQASLVDKVRDTLAETGLEGRWLELELTEVMVMNHRPETLDTLLSLKQLGVQLSIDDFGRGYAALDRMRRFPIDTVKIDACFVQGMENDADSAAVTGAIIALAHSLKLKVIAEGVETLRQANILNAHACDGLQGYLIGKPMSAEDFAFCLTSGKENAVCQQLSVRR